MKSDFADAMRRATLAARAHDVVNATKIILKAVTGRAASDDANVAAMPSTLRLIRPEHERSDATGPAAPHAGRRAEEFRAGGFRRRMPLGEVLRALREGRLAVSRPDPESWKQPSRAPAPEGAQFVTRAFSCAAGARDYKLYVPAPRRNAPQGLIVMLHGCKQDPDDFAAGTDMNAVAEAHGLLVAYPRQPKSANASACWNWFNPGDQVRGAGEPSIIAGITQSVVAEFGVDPRRVFVAGLSAGGAMAAVMGANYPDLYAAVGVHSGLPYRSAQDVASAFAAMRGAASAGGLSYAQPGRPTIVFHGTRDRTVHPSNAERIVEAACDRLGTVRNAEESHGIEGGRHYARTILRGAGGAPAVEFWRIEGAGHAWSGGRREGSFADPKGPSASEEMVRFFLAQAPRSSLAVARAMFQRARS
jgi:poly(hydroxyalkanoate) depolymerase family esterase